jgi:predicted RNA-binding Zn-ribbon protein involved in translation (DUF1610 family)
MKMRLIACNSCGVVLDPNAAVFEEKELLNHDGDKICDSIKCPVCGNFIKISEYKLI